jgi:hypothetical protein
MGDLITPRDVRDAASDLTVQAAQLWLDLAIQETVPSLREVKTEAAAHLARLTRQIMSLAVTNDEAA